MDHCRSGFWNARMCWHCGITAWQNLCLLQFSLLLLPGLSQHLWSWASCSQHFQHLTPLQNCSSDGFKDFSSAAAASRQHCTVNIYLCVKPLQLSVPSALIEYHTSLVLYMVGPPKETQRHGCVLPAAPGSLARQSPWGTRSCPNTVDKGKCWA